MKNLHRMMMIASLTVISCSSKNPIKQIMSSSEPVSASGTPGEMVVIQSGGRSPIISTSDAKRWIQLSESEGSSAGKLYGLIATGEWQSAIQEARRNLEINPGDENFMTILGAAFASGRNYEMAGYYGSLVLNTNSQNSDAMNLVGLRIMMASENRRGDFDDAIAWFRKAADSDSTHVAGLLNMGYLQLDLGDARGAGESFALASNRCNRCFDSQYGYGVASSRSMSWANAKNAFEGVLSNNPSRAEAQYQLALVYKNGLNNQNEAIKLLQEIVSDADGRFKNASEVKRVANITLRRLKAGDRSGPIPEEGTMPHGGEMPARAL